MKNLHNKKISFMVEQFDSKINSRVEAMINTSYLELLFNTCKRPTENGYSWDLIEKISRIKDLYEANKSNEGIIQIEDADFSL